MVLIAVGIVGSYLLLLFFPIAVWRKMPFTSSEKHEGKVSVIIPFRNEELNLRRLAESLEAQTYSSFEVLFVNDHSTDDSLNVLKCLVDKGITLSLNIISLEETQGKKAALAAGIAQATGEIIVTTDADCWCNENWLKAMTSGFHNPQTQMITGPVVLEGMSFFQKLQRIEFGAVLASSAALIGLSKPTMANGANLAYRKSVFNEVNGFSGIEQTPSGDDELLMMKIVKKYPKSVVFAKSAEAVVHTLAHVNWTNFVQQRKRWASKWKVGMRRSTILSALFVYMVQLAFVGLVLLFFLGELPLSSVAGLWLIKIILEFLLIRNYFDDLKQPYSFFHFVLLQTFYPFYVLYVGLASNFGRFQWKDRSFKI
ncbi:glycosyltransferase [Roseivirga sp.]|uniref:glycosyltransferase n=1 Tax=Roseivirga sp. TaxID=1964215 RepID=UPI002B276AFB|nr:glycosyltransferase [Roseivirga sp.]